MSIRTNKNEKVEVVRIKPKRYVVIENQSTHVLTVTNSKKDAIEYANVSIGKGFEGWTPRYLLNPTEQQEVMPQQQQQPQTEK